MSIVNTTACCCQAGPFDPCDQPTQGSYVQVSLQYRIATAMKYKLKNSGQCIPCTPGPCDSGGGGGATATFGANSFSGSASPGDPSCGYVDVEVEEKESFDMPSAYTAAIPWVASGYATQGIAWHLPDTGMRTSFIAPGTQRVDTYQGQAAGLRYTENSGVCCCGGTLVTDAGCTPINCSASFRSWWSYTNGPDVYAIRRSTGGSTARRWRVTGGNFQILNAGGTVLASVTLAGNTLASLRNALNASAAAVTVTWAVTNPDAFSQGLTAELFGEQLNAGLTNIPASTSPPSFVRLFVLTAPEEVPDIPAGQCSSAADSIGWFASIGNIGGFGWGDGALLYTGNAVYDYGRGVCNKATYRQLCGGVQFEGATGFYNPNNHSMDTILNCGAFTWTDYAVCPGPCIAGPSPNGWFYNASGGLCCDAQYERIPCVATCADSCQGAPPSNPFPGGYWRVAPLGGGPWVGQSSYSVSGGDHGANFSGCCAAGYECWCYGWTRSDSIMGSVWSQLQRLA